MRYTFDSRFAARGEGMSPPRLSANSDSQVLITSASSRTSNSGSACDAALDADAALPDCATGVFLTVCPPGAALADEDADAEVDSETFDSEGTPRTLFAVS